MIGLAGGAAGFSVVIGLRLGVGSGKAGYTAGGVGMAAVRTATVTWQGDLMRGSGGVSAGSSGTFQDLPVSCASLTEAPDGRTSPEELLAAAHAACFAMAVSSDLTKAAPPPAPLHVAAPFT